MTVRQRDEKRRRRARSNPEQGPARERTVRKPPEAWVTGNRPMTDAQSAYLKMLCERAGEAFFARMTKAEASQRIRLLRSRRW